MNNKINQCLRIVKQMRRGFGTWCTNSYTSDKTPSRCPPDASAGRSMVEMLGVLAIIGVLSVGAIAGYSKAMMKYKLNKQAESFNSLLNSAIQLYPDLTRTYAVNKFNYATGAQFVLSIFDKMNLIPDGMSIQNNYIVDIFKNHIWFSYYNGNDGTSNEYLMYVTLARTGNTLSSHDKEFCRNIVTVAGD